VVFGGRTPPDSEAHSTGAELLSNVTTALAAASTPSESGAAGKEARRSAGLLLWAGLHGNHPTLVPDLDMAGARGSAIAAFVSLPDASGVSIIERVTESARTRYSHA
jgi:hypothetical protein